MTNTPIPLDPIAQLVAKYQSNGHQTIASQPQPASPSQQRKGWTGFAERTLWDWLNLLGVLLVPLILGAGTILITAQQSAISQSQHESDQRIADNQFQEGLLKTFRDDINHLVFEQQLLTAKYGDPVQIMAQSYTNDALRKLDLFRRGLLVQFLSDLRLITSNPTNPPLISLNGVNLSGADLSGADLSEDDLSGTNLSGTNLRWDDLQRTDLSGTNLQRTNLRWTNLRWADLSETNLQKADLTGADLSDVNLRWSNLSGVNLSETNLQRADLTGADLSETKLLGAYLSRADLSRAKLSEADLSGANLSGDTVTPEQLADVYLLKNAILPDGSHYPSASYPISNHQEPTVSSNRSAK